VKVTAPALGEAHVAIADPEVVMKSSPLFAVADTLVESGAGIAPHEKFCRSVVVLLLILEFATALRPPLTGVVAPAGRPNSAKTDRADKAPARGLIGNI
jgi:hypothetical protein